jgi:UDP-N-acetylmuramate dehydrogenase
VDEPLAPHTSFRIGGPVDYLVFARTREDVVDAIGLANELGQPWLVLGRGSNVLVDDAGIRGVVVRNDSSGLVVEPDTGLVRADSGVRLPTIGARTAKVGLSGFEFAVGIPGTVGGGVVMNAGAHGGCVADVLVAAEVLRCGERAVWDVSRLDYSYRTSRLQSCRDVVVLGGTFQLTAVTPGEALARIAEFRQHRQDTQPVDPGAGSIFRNPPGASAGALIDRAGLKGQRRGGALISPKHGNFIVNVGGATSADVRALVELARESVLRQFGIELHPEMELIGPRGRETVAAPREPGNLVGS